MKTTAWDVEQRLTKQLRKLEDSLSAEQAIAEDRLHRLIASEALCRNWEIDNKHLLAEVTNLQQQLKELREAAQKSLDASDAILLCHLNSDDDEQHEKVAQHKRKSDAALREILGRVGK